MPIQHEDAQQVHKFAYVSSSDPGAVGAHKAWVDTSTTPYSLKIRSVANTFWLDVGIYDTDLITIAGLTPTDDDVIQRKAGAWTNRTLAQLKTDLALNLVPNVDARPRSTHTGTQLASTISDFTSAATAVTTNVLEDWGSSGPQTIGENNNSAARLSLNEVAGTATLGGGPLNPYLVVSDNGIEIYDALDNLIGKYNNRGLSGKYDDAVVSSANLNILGNLCHVTGTTNITSITDTNFVAGAIITLIFDGALTVTNGNNLKLNGNFVTTANDTLTLAYDGTNFYEIARSTNS